MKVLETDRLALRQLSTDDAAFILGLLNEPSFIRFIGDKGVRTLDDAREYILRGPVDSYERHGFGLYLTERKSDGAPIGMCGLLKRDALQDADIGFAFSPAFWGKGYAIEAASAVMAYAEGILQLPRVVAVVSPDNDSSKKLLGRLGLRFEQKIKLSEDDSEIDLFARTFSGGVP